MGSWPGVRYCYIQRKRKDHCGEGLQVKASVAYTPDPGLPPDPLHQLMSWDKGYRLNSGSHWPFNVKQMDRIGLSKLDNWLRRFPEVCPLSPIGWETLQLPPSLYCPRGACCLATDLRPPGKWAPSFTSEVETTTLYRHRKLSPLNTPPTSHPNNAELSQVLVPFALRQLWAGVAVTRLGQERAQGFFLKFFI